MNLNTDGLVMAALEANLWFIVGGSILGTLFFYGGAYLLVRKRAR